ncbi:ABC transporter permease [Tessaracoccus rhinocerotis]|uniref:ABC transporter permease n=1 Tax=Tessaracoccus rhinocerotis TaxID=1689449 RepID=A0A553K2B0_9ACTN|nr:ABC transporter permease [Tessaracoccus rhinocerotis]TRY18837.1 ABC transporter permease [Tessaracoccus rhinocerotis]
MKTYTKPRFPWWIVARREIMAKLADKGFWISTAVVVALIGLGLGASFLFASAQGNMTVGVTDEAGREVVAIAVAESEQPIDVVEMPADEFDSAIEAGSIDAGISRTDDGWDLVVESIETSTGAIQSAITKYVTATNAEALGIDPAELEVGSQVEVRLAGEQVADDAVVALVTGMVFSVLFFMSAMFYGLQIAQSVVEEKESRLVEILSAAVPTRDLLVGKALGNTIMALGQLLLFIAMGAIGVSITEFGAFLPVLLPNIGWFVLFFVVGFAALSTLWAATGAMATRVQDINNTTMPLMMILMVVYLAGFFARGSLATVLSYVPVVSSVVMPQRLLNGTAGWLDALVALLLCGVFMVFSIRLGSLIYRRGLMKTSGILKLGELFSKAS